MPQCWRTHHEAHNHHSCYVSWKSVCACQLNLLPLKQTHNLSGHDINAHTPVRTEECRSTEYYYSRFRLIEIGQYWIRQLGCGRLGVVQLNKKNC